MPMKTKKTEAELIQEYNPFRPMTLLEVTNQLIIRALKFNDKMKPFKSTLIADLFCHDPLIRIQFKQIVRTAAMLDKIDTLKKIWTWLMFDLDIYAARFDNEVRMYREKQQELRILLAKRTKRNA